MPRRLKAPLRCGPALKSYTAAQRIECRADCIGNRILRGMTLGGVRKIRQREWYILVGAGRERGRTYGTIDGGRG